MRVEKKYLIAEVEEHLQKSDYVILTNYNGITVEETAQLRAQLAESSAEFHVVKNSSLKVAAAAMGLPDLGDAMNGPTAVIVGGDNSPGVAKALTEFFEEKNKVSVKSAVLAGKILTPDDVKALAELPSLGSLRALLLGLLVKPATMLVQVLNAPAQEFSHVLQAKVRADGGED